jgi:hypothetical protein
MLRCCACHSQVRLWCKTRQSAEASADVVFEQGNACQSFPVHLQTDARGYVKVFASGELQSTGYERASVTNLSSGKQLEFMVNGRVRIIFAPSGGEANSRLMAADHHIFPGRGGSWVESEFRMYYFKGNANAIIDENFAFFEFVLWNSVDLCAALS